jgi:hypothetical protein
MDERLQIDMIQKFPWEQFKLRTSLYNGRNRESDADRSKICTSNLLRLT